MKRALSIAAVMVAATFLVTVIVVYSWQERLPQTLGSNPVITFRLMYAFPVGSEVLLTPEAAAEIVRRNGELPPSPHHNQPFGTKPDEAGTVRNYVMIDDKIFCSVEHHGVSEAYAPSQLVIKK